MQELVERAHKTVEHMLRDAVNTSTDQNQFAHNMAYCQIVATRMLAVLIFNSTKQSNKDSESIVRMALDGVMNELAEIQKASEEDKLDSVEVKFNEQAH